MQTTIKSHAKSDADSKIVFRCGLYLIARIRHEISHICFHRFRSGNYGMRITVARKLGERI
jgi:hypothetical protein